LHPRPLLCEQELDAIIIWQNKSLSVIFMFIIKYFKFRYTLNP